jgi:hypothetical protein
VYKRQGKGIKQLEGDLKALGAYRVTKYYTTQEDACQSANRLKLAHLPTAGPEWSDAIKRAKTVLEEILSK